MCPKGHQRCALDAFLANATNPKLQNNAKRRAAPGALSGLASCARELHAGVGLLASSRMALLHAVEPRPRAEAQPNPPATPPCTMQALGSSRNRGAAVPLETAETMRPSAAAGSVKATAPMPGQTSARAAHRRMPCEHSTLTCAVANEQVRPKSQPLDAELATQRDSAPRFTQSTGAGEPERPTSPFEHAKPVCVAGLREESCDAPLSFGRSTHKDQVAAGWAAVTKWCPIRPLPRQAASFVGVLFAIVLYLVCGLSAELSQMLGVDARISRPSRQGKYPLHWIIRVGWAPLSLLVVLLPPCSAQCSHCVLHCGCTLRQDRPGFAYIAGYIAEEPPTASGTIYSSQA